MTDKAITHWHSLLKKQMKIVIGFFFLWTNCKGMTGDTVFLRSAVKVSNNEEV